MGAMLVHCRIVMARNGRDNDAHRSIEVTPQHALQVEIEFRAALRFVLIALTRVLRSRCACRNRNGEQHQTDCYPENRGPYVH